MNVTIAIALLQETYSLIDRGAETWICWALDDALCITEGPDLLVTRRHLKDYIRDSLDGYEFMSRWLSAQTGRVVRPCGTMTMARLAWIDRMIYELEHEGKLP